VPGNAIGHDRGDASGRTLDVERAELDQSAEPGVIAAVEIDPVGHGCGDVASAVSLSYAGTPARRGSIG